MPGIILARHDRALQALAQGANGVRALQTQAQQNISTPTGQVAWRTGQLLQYPDPSTNPIAFTAGYGWEVPASFDPAQPAVRSGIVSWVGGTSNGSTLAASASAGANTVSSNASYSAGAYVQIDTGASAEGIQVTGVSGSGPYTLTLAAPLLHDHSSGAAIALLYQRTIFGMILFNASGQVAQTFTTTGQQSWDESGFLLADTPFVDAGTVTLAAGTATVSLASVGSNSIIRVFNISASGTVGALSVTLGVGTFTINSTSATDASKVRWEVVALDEGGILT